MDAPLGAGGVASQKTGPGAFSKRLPLMLESCGSSGPGNCKLMTDLVLDLNTRPRADSPGLPPRGAGISARIKQGSAESGEPVAAGTGKQACACVCVYSHVSKMRQYVLLCLKDTIRVRLRGARSPPAPLLVAWASRSPKWILVQWF